MHNKLLKFVSILFVSLLLTGCISNGGGGDEGILVTDVELSKESVELKIEDSYKIEASITPKYATNRKLDWSSVNPNIATVDSTGKITGVSVGNTKVKVSTNDASDIVKEVAVTVISNIDILVTSVSLSTYTAEVKENESFPITATVLPNDATDKTLNWVSANESVATVTNAGVIWGVKKGTTIISVSTNDASTITKDIAVTVTSGSIDPNPTYQERVKNMSQIGITLDANDANAPASATYDATKTLGSVSHPLVKEVGNYVEIISIEQPVAYGDAYLITSGDASILIDFGNDSSEYYDNSVQYGEYLTNLFTKYVPSKHLNLLVMSHPHADHYAGYPAVRSYFDSVDLIVDYGYSSGCRYESQIRNYYKSKGADYWSIYDAVHELNGALSRTYVTPDVIIDWYDTGLYTANVNSNTPRSDENVTCLVGMLSYHKFSYYFSGDLQGVASYGEENYDGERWLVDTNKNNPLFHSATMIKIAHHGSTYASQDFLLNILEPLVATISAGGVTADTTYSNKTGICAGHPHYQAVNRLLKKGTKRAVPKVYLNSVNGTTSFVTDGLNSLYMEGNPLQRNLIGTNNVDGTKYTVNYTVGDVKDRYHEIKDTDYYKTCYLY